MVRRETTTNYIKQELPKNKKNEQELGPIPYNINMGTFQQVDELIKADQSIRKQVIDKYGQEVQQQQQPQNQE